MLSTLGLQVNAGYRSSRWGFVHMGASMEELLVDIECPVRL